MLKAPCTPSRHLRKPDVVICCRRLLRRNVLMLIIGQTPRIILAGLVPGAVHNNTIKDTGNDEEWQSLFPFVSVAVRAV